MRKAIIQSVFSIFIVFATFDSLIKYSHANESEVEPLTYGEDTSGVEHFSNEKRALDKLKYFGGLGKRM